MVKKNETDEEEIIRHVNHLLGYHAKYFGDNNVNTHDGAPLMLATYNNMVIAMMKLMGSKKSRIAFLEVQSTLIATISSEMTESLEKMKKHV